MKVIPPLDLTSALINSTVVETDAVDGPEWTEKAYNPGDLVRRSYLHRTYRAAVAVASGTGPPEVNVSTTPPKWVLVGSTNPWRMLRTDANYQTSAASPLVVKLKPGGRVAAIGILGLQADSITISTDTGYSYTQALRSRVTTSWSDYFLGAFQYQAAVLRLDLPPTLNATITITITRAGLPVLCGPIVLGNPIDLGTVEAGPTAGARSFSGVNRDAFGGGTFVKRKRVPKTSQRTMFDKPRSDAIRQAMNDADATVSLWFGLEDPSDAYFNSLAVLGFPTDWRLDLKHPENAYLLLDLEGY